MKRSEFLRNLSILPLLTILGCSSTVNSKAEPLMTSKKARTGIEVKFKYKVTDKDGNIKKTGQVVSSPKENKKE